VPDISETAEENPAPVTLCPPKIKYGLTRNLITENAAGKLRPKGIKLLNIHFYHQKSSLRFPWLSLFNYAILPAQDALNML
jgi:hypothetical protein